MSESNEPRADSRRDAEADAQMLARGTALSYQQALLGLLLADIDDRTDAFRKMDALAAEGKDTPEYRAAWAQFEQSVHEGGSGYGDRSRLPGE